MTTEPIPSALPPGPSGATGAQPGPNGDLRWHDAAGKDLGVVQNAPAEDDFASAGHPVPSASNDDFASAGVAADDFSNAGHPAPAHVDQNPLRGAAEATSIGPREHGPISDSMFARFFRGGASASDVAAAHTWLQDLQSDVRNGTGSTSVGRLLQHLGAKGTSSGNPEAVGDVMAGPLLGVPQIMEGGALAAEGHPVKAANKVIAGVGTTFGPLAASQPEAIPFIGAGMIGQHAGAEVARGVGADEDTAELVGNVVGLVSGGLTTEHGTAALDKGIDTSKQVASRVADKIKNTADFALGKAANFDTAIRRISEPTKKQYAGYVEKLESARPDLQSILNNDPKIDSPAKFAAAIDDHIQSQNAELAARANATKDSREPVVPNIMQRVDAKLDEFFDANKGRYGTADQVEAAKQKVRDRIMQEKGGDEEGLREPNLFEAENIRKGLNDTSKPPLGMPVGADQAASMIGGSELKSAIDESYTTKGIDNVAEFRQRQSELIDIRDKIAEAQKKADDLGQPGIIKSLMKKIGVPSSVIAIAMGHPVSAAAVGAAVLGDTIHGNVTNPLSNLARATELASRNPGAEPLNIEHTIPAEPTPVVPPPVNVPPPVDHALHAELATAFHTTIGESDPTELKNRFLDGLRKRQADALAAGKPFEPTTKEENTLKAINASDANARQAAYDEQVKLAEAQKVTAEKQAIEAQKAQAKAAEEQKRQADEAQKKQAEAALAAKEMDQARDASEEENETTRSVMEDHILPHKYEVMVADPEVEGGSRTQVVSAYSHANALDNARLIENYRGNENPDITIKQELPREEQDYHVPVDKLARMPATLSGKSAEATIKHELGHVLVAHLNGVSPEEIISHKHDLLAGSNARAAALVDESKWQEKDGSYTRKSLGNNFPKLIENWMAGHAADELFSGIDRDSNPSNSDRNQVTKVLKGFGFSNGEAQQIIDAATTRAKEKLDHPVTSAIIKENAPYREEGLAPSHHYSPERIERLKVEHDKRMAEHEFRERQAEEREKEAAREEGNGREAASANQLPIDQAVRPRQPGVESEGQARDRGEAAQGVSETEGRELQRAADQEERSIERRAADVARSKKEMIRAGLPTENIVGVVRGQLRSEGWPKEEAIAAANKAVEDLRDKINGASPKDQEERRAVPRIGSADYKPSEKAQTMSSERKDYGPEFDAAQAQHDIDRNKSIIRNPKATAEDIEAARRNLFELQNPDLHRATVLTDQEDYRSKFTDEQNRQHDEAVEKNRPVIAQRNLEKAHEWGIESTPEGELVLYHGTQSGDAIRKSGKLNQGTFLVGDPKIAKQFADAAGSSGRRSEVMKVKVPAGTVLGGGGNQGYFQANEEIPLKEITDKKPSAMKDEEAPVAVPPERSTGTPAHDEAIRAGGAIPGGVMRGDPSINLPELTLFHDPKSGSTLALKTEQGVTADKVAEKLKDSRAQYEAAKKPALSVMQETYVNPKQEPEFKSAVANTPGAKLNDDGSVTLDLSRHQKPEQAGARAIRSGVFFTPEENSPYSRHYKVKEGSNDTRSYGGDQKVVEKQVTLQNPLVVKGSTGGKVPERVYDHLKGKNAYENMRRDVLDSIPPRGVPGIEYGDRVDRIAEVLKKYGADPDYAEEIFEHSKESNQLPYAIQEHIVAQAIRDAGFQSAMGFSKHKGQPRLSEVFDASRTEYPVPE